MNKRSDNIMLIREEWTSPQYITFNIYFFVQLYKDTFFCFPEKENLVFTIHSNCSKKVFA